MFFKTNGFVNLINRFNAKFTKFSCAEKIFIVVDATPQKAQWVRVRDDTGSNPAVQR